MSRDRFALRAVGRLEMEAAALVLDGVGEDVPAGCPHWWAVSDRVWYLSRRSGLMRGREWGGGDGVAEAVAGEAAVWAASLSA